MEVMYEWMRRIACGMVLISVILHLAARKTYQKYMRIYTGILLILLTAGPVLTWFGGGSVSIADRAEAVYADMEQKLEEKIGELGAELEVPEIFEQEEEGEEPEHASGEIKVEVGEIQLGE